MASAIIHICVAKKINEKLKMKENELYLGSIAPDIAKQIGEDKSITHFIGLEQDIPDITYFLSKYQDSLDNPFEMGYYIHLYTDKIWYEDFFSRYVTNCSIHLNDGTTLETTEENVRKIIYNDYTNINISLIDLYGLDLSLFYEEMNDIATIIKEYPMDKSKILVDKMGLIIENSNQDPIYVFNMEEIKQFIDSTADIIYNKIINMKIVEKV